MMHEQRSSRAPTRSLKVLVTPPTGWSGYLASAGFFTHRAASTLGDPVQKHALE